MKKIRFDRYAKRRLKWRKILEEEAILTISQPDYKESTIKDRYNSFKEISGRIIKVTHKETENEVYVITVMVKSKNERFKK